MIDKKPQQPINRSSPRLRPGQDIVVRKQAAQFPNVGQTFSSYKHDPITKGQHTASPRGAVAKTGRFKRIRQKITLKRAVITMLVLILLIVGVLAGKFIYNAQRIFGGNILGVLQTTKLKGEDVGRVNILLAGNSADDVGHDGGELTDSIMIISIDTKNNSAYLLSVPRDLWIMVGDYSHQKINEAYVTGEGNDFSKSGYPEGGMGQLEEVIEDNMGIDINYYALVNYQALKQSVDAVGGIDFNVKSSSSYGLYDPSIDYVTKGPLVKLTNGTHKLNGQQALNLSRARGDAYGSYGFEQSDFTRTENQRKILIALKSKAVSAGVLSNPAKLSSLSDAIGGNVKSDFTLSELRRLYDVTKSISGNRIKSLSLNDANGINLLDSYTTPLGQSALIPAAGLDDFSAIKSFIAQQTSSNPVVREAARLVVLNATDMSGIATKEKTTLTDKKLAVLDIGDANTTQATTSIIDNSKGKKPSTKKYLLERYGNHFTTVNPYANIYEADFIIIIGQDRLPASPTTNQ